MKGFFYTNDLHDWGVKWSDASLQTVVDDFQAVNYLSIGRTWTPKLHKAGFESLYRVEIVHESSQALFCGYMWPSLGSNSRDALALLVAQVQSKERINETYKEVEAYLVGKHLFPANSGSPLEKKGFWGQKYSSLDWKSLFNSPLEDLNPSDLHALQECISDQSPIQFTLPHLKKQVSKKSLFSAFRNVIHRQSLLFFLMGFGLSALMYTQQPKRLTSTDQKKPVLKASKSLQIQKKKLDIITPNDPLPFKIWEMYALDQQGYGLYLSYNPPQKSDSARLESVHSKDQTLWFRVMNKECSLLQDNKRVDDLSLELTPQNLRSHFIEIQMKSTQELHCQIKIDQKSK